MSSQLLYTKYPLSVPMPIFHSPEYIYELNMVLKCFHTKNQNISNFSLHKSVLQRVLCEKLLSEKILFIDSLYKKN